MIVVGDSFFNQPPNKNKNNYDDAFLEYFKIFSNFIDPKIANKKHFLKRFIDIFLNDCFKTLLHKNLFIYKYIFKYSDLQILKKLRYLGLNHKNYHQNILESKKQFDTMVSKRILN